ncbi:MAG TPA: hypothetical protein VGD65_21070 [Chryseosolibacter sp.]
MVQTVIGIFDESSHAECAVHELMDNNFDREHIDVSLPPDPSETRGDGTDENGVLDSKVGRYFMSVFNDTQLAMKYATVAQRGTVIAVLTHNYSDAVKAAGILDGCGALNVDEQFRVLDDAMTRDDRRAEARIAKTELNSEPDSEMSKERSPSLDSSVSTPHGVHREGIPGSVMTRSRIIHKTTNDEIHIQEDTWIDRRSLDDLDEGKV